MLFSSISTTFWLLLVNLVNFFREWTKSFAVVRYAANSWIVRNPIVVHSVSQGSLADLGGGRQSGHPKMTRPLVAMMLCMILGAFGVSAQFAPLQLHSLDPPVPHMYL